MWPLMGWHLADRRVWRFFLLSTVNGSILWPETWFRFCWLFNPLQLNKNQTVYNKSHFIHETFQSACLLGEYIRLEIFIPTPFPSPTRACSCTLKHTPMHACTHQPPLSSSSTFWMIAFGSTKSYVLFDRQNERIYKKEHQRKIICKNIGFGNCQILCSCKCFFFLLFLSFFCGVHDETHCSVILAIRTTLNLIGISIQDHI